MANPMPISLGSDNRSSGGPAEPRTAARVPDTAAIPIDEALPVAEQIAEAVRRKQVVQGNRNDLRRGVCVWFTGLSGAGKSTTAARLIARLEGGGRVVTFLDGDLVRTHLSKGLGFSKEDRDSNVRRIGFVASEVVRHGGIVVCAAVSPYRATRREVRTMLGGDRFVEVFVDTPLKVCEGRDVKGLYAKARRGEVTSFTGIDDPYEHPEHPEITLDTVSHAVEANTALILRYLRDHGFVLGGD